MTTDVDSYMFGSILAMSRGDVALSVALCAAVLALLYPLLSPALCRHV